MRISSLMFIAIAACLLASSALAQTGLRHDAYGDPLPPGAVLRLGTTRLQTRGGFAWTPDGKSLITMKSGTVFFWDMDDGHCHQTLSVPIDAGYATRLALSNSGKTLVCTDRLGAAAVWNLATFEQVAIPPSRPRTEHDNLAA